MQIKVRPLKKLTRHIFDEKRYHEDNSSAIIASSKKDLIWHIPEKILFIDKYLSKNEKNWFLIDFGCGTAENIKRNILPLMKKGKTYMGIDVSKKLLIRAKKNIPTGIFVNAPMGEIDLTSKKADYLSFFGALHHDENPKRTILRASKFLKTGGFIFLREPNETAFKKGYGASPWEAGLNSIKLKNWLEEAGFKIIEWHYLNTKPFHFLRKWLARFRLHCWEKIPILWRIKVKIELFIEKPIGIFFKSLRGTDMFIVAKKIK